MVMIIVLDTLQDTGTVRTDCIAEAELAVLQARI